MVHLAMNDAIFLQLAKLQRQHPLGNPRANPAKLVKSNGYQFRWISRKQQLCP